ncbi:MAG TPA: serine/threonine-protein kinase [Streptosporangiaceae bacterium]|nr:serine/threonine-protein kinase [Streptosporangiaceae bacterium]
MSSTLLAGRYQLENCLAIGGMGEVWRGWDQTLARPVAVKLMRDCYSQDPRSAARLRAEARCAGRLTHRGVVRVYDYGEDRRPFLVMELVEGLSLAQVLPGGPLEPHRALDLVAQVCWALDAAHSAGIVHGDIKPGNLLIGRDGDVKLTDFGVACPADDPAGCVEVVVGTAAYVAPERMTGQPATVAADLYSVGIVLFECLTATRPFSGTTVEVALAHQLQELPALPAAIPAGIAALLGALTAKDPGHRPRSAAAAGVQAAFLRDQLCGNDGQPVSEPRVSDPRGAPDPALMDLCLTRA